MSVYPRLLCDCQHNTCGPSCDRCCPGFNQFPWKPATTYSANECEREFSTLRPASPRYKDLVPAGTSLTHCSQNMISLFWEIFFLLSFLNGRTAFPLFVPTVLFFMYERTWHLKVRVWLLQKVPKLNIFTSFLPFCDLFLSSFSQSHNPSEK